MSLIELKGICFRYSSGEEDILRDFSLSVEAGDCVILEGDNGAGKSTLFRILNGLSFPQKGSYFFDGSEITKAWLNREQRARQFHKRIGYLFQNPDVMLFNASVYEEIAFGLRQMGMTDAKVDARVEDCLKLFGLEKLADKAPYHLSGGQKKKVALAAVMAMNPEVLILDEPFAGLDRASMDFLTQLLRQLSRAGKTLLIATHQDPQSFDIPYRVISLTGRS